MPLPFGAFETFPHFIVTYNFINACGGISEYMNNRTLISILVEDEDKQILLIRLHQTEVF